MPRDIPVSNGNLLVAFDAEYRIREFFFPHLGEEKHTNGNPFKMGIWVDGSFSWVDKSWKIEMKYLNESLVTDVKLLNEKLKIELKINNLVDFHENIYKKNHGTQPLLHQEGVKDISVPRF